VRDLVQGKGGVSLVGGIYGYREGRRVGVTVKWSGTNGGDDV